MESFVIPESIPFQPYTFLGKFCDLAYLNRAHAIIVPVPYDRTASFMSGSRNGPAEIILASRQLEFFDSEIKRSIADEFEIATCPELEPTNDPEIMLARVEKLTRSLIDLRYAFVFGLGGDHSITLGFVKANKAKSLDPFTVLQFDAHSDLYDSYENSKFSHASVARRISEYDIPIVQAGIRSTNRELEEYSNQLKNFSVFPAHHEIFNQDYSLEKMAKLVVASISTEKVYVTIDVDCFEPSVIGFATGTPEPGGLSWGQVVAILKEVARSKTVLGADLVEFMPSGPNSSGQAFLMAKLVYKFLSYILAFRKYSTFSFAYSQK